MNADVRIFEKYCGDFIEKITIPNVASVRIKKYSDEQAKQLGLNDFDVCKMYCVITDTEGNTRIFRNSCVTVNRY